MTVTFRDGDDLVVAAAEEATDTLGPQQEGAVTDSLFAVASAGTMEVFVGRTRLEPVQGSFGAFEVSGLNAVSGFGGPTVTGDLLSRFDQDFDDVRVVIVFYRDESIVGGDFTFQSNVPADGRTGFEVNSFHEVDFDAVRGFAALKNLSLLGG